MIFRRSKNFIFSLIFGKIIKQKTQSFLGIGNISRRHMAASTVDILFPRDAGKYIAENSKHVKICEDGVDKTAKMILDLVKNKPQEVRVDRWDLHVLNPTTRDQFAIDWVFVTDLLNFSFWSDDESNKYAVNYKSNTWTGYWSLCAAINRALDEGISIVDPKYYGTIDLKRLEYIFRSDTAVSMPMLQERVNHLHEAANVLLTKYDGTFLNVVKAANQSAQKLMEIVVNDFPCFRDEAVFAGKKVAIYKRVQILIGDLWASCGGKGHGTFHDIDSLTMFADYRIPQALVWLGALKYSDELMEKLNNSEALKNGEPEEVEIRGCSIHACELIVKAIREMMGKDAAIPEDTPMNAIVVDHFLWDYRRAHADETRHIPIHKTRCVYY